MSDETVVENTETETVVTPPAFDEKRIASIVNAAMTDHTKRLQKSFDAQLSKALEEKIKALTPVAPVVPAIAEEPKPKGKEKEIDPEVTRLLAEQKTQAEAIKKLTEAAAAADKRAADATKKAMDEKAFNSLRTSLAERGVTPQLVDVAARDLFHAQRRVSFDEEGNALLRVKQSPYAGAPEEEVDIDLSSGVDEWIKSKEASAFMPAPADQKNKKVTPGRGPVAKTGGTNQISAASNDSEKIRYAMELERALLNSR